MDDTARLGLPLIAAAQSQKHVTHNEAVLALDALVHLACLDRDLASPPANPGEGDRYIVAGAPAGAWAGHAGDVAEWRDGVWHFTAARAGFIAFVADEAALLVRDGSGWTGLGDVLGQLRRVGIGAAADGANPFTAKLNSALWTARAAGEGGTGDLRIVVNKAVSSGTASFLFQTGYSGRAEFGLAGSDGVSIKVSPDGSTWRTALSVDPATAELRANSVSVNNGGGFALRDSSGHSVPFPLIQGDDNVVYYSSKSDGSIYPIMAQRANSATNQPLVFYVDVWPGPDNAYTLGRASSRWSSLYVASGTISTSDARHKTEISPLSDGEVEAASALAREIGTFQFLDSVAAKGPAARRHVGLTVQRACEIMRGHGLDPCRYGFVCHDAWEGGRATSSDLPGHAAGDLWSFRPDQLLLFVARGQERRIAALEARLAAAPG